jgi:hypothetical protein
MGEVNVFPPPVQPHALPAAVHLAATPLILVVPDHVLLEFGGLTPRSCPVETARDPRCRVCR